jgi:hypothetical protein
MGCSKSPWARKTFIFFSSCYAHEYDLNIPRRHGIRIEDRGARQTNMTYPSCTGGSGAIGGTLISVIEGRVSVTSKTRGDSSAPSVSAGRGRRAAATPAQVASLDVSANQEVHVDHAGAMSVHTIVDASDAVAWQQRRLVFRRQTLANIVEEFNRYNHQQVRVEGAEALARVYSGVFDADDLDSLAWL